MTSPYDQNNAGGNAGNSRPGGAREQRNNDRVSVPSAREMLEKESRAYSSNRGTGSWGNESPSEQKNRAEAAKQLEDYDFMAPFRKPGVPEYRVRPKEQTPTRRYADTSSNHYQAGTNGEGDQPARPSVRRSAGSRPSVRREQERKQQRADSKGRHVFD